MLENEITHLISRLPDLEELESKEIDQHYLGEGPDPLRLRRIGGGFELTKKVQPDPDDPSRKHEYTIPLESEEFDALRQLSVRSLRKTRYFLPLEGGLTAEIDVFHDDLEGLSMVEVEFPNEPTRSAFVIPGWFGRDITTVHWSHNSFLAGKKLADIKEHLD